MSIPTLYEQHPQAVEWILKLLRNATPPGHLAVELGPIKEDIYGFLGAQVGLTGVSQLPTWVNPATTSNAAPQRPSVLAARPYATVSGATASHTTTSCPTCGQQARIDASSEKCGVCQKPMVVRHNRVTGQAFLGCTGYPTCRGTRNLSALLLKRAQEAAARLIVMGAGEELRKIEL